MTMNSSKSSILIPLIPILTIFALAGCQPKSDTTPKVEKTNIPLVQAQVVAVELPKQKVCLEDGCTNYDLQTVKAVPKEPWDQQVNYLVTQSSVIRCVSR